jgi:predicted nucleotide-binding protein
MAASSVSADRPYSIDWTRLTNAVVSEKSQSTASPAFTSACPASVQSNGASVSQEHPARIHRLFEEWDEQVVKWLDANYPGTGLSAEWSALSYSILVTSSGYNSSPNAWESFNIAVQKRLAWLGKLDSTVAKKPEKSVRSNRIFIVHGHDEAIRETVARFVEKLGLDAIVLHEQPNKGRTIIEKFTDHADVGFAIVLLTPDDIGGVVGTPPEELRPRARQNVVFELGYFTASLGRHKVCALHKGDIEIPSDYGGVVYVQIDPAGAWKFQVAKEMKAAGLPVDLNLTMSMN